MAASMAMAFEKADIKVSEIYSDDIREALNLATRLYDAVAVNSLNFTHSESNLFVICEPDTKIENIADDIILPPGSILIHTSITQPLSVFNNHLSSVVIGVLAPLYHFKHKETADFREIPILVESEDDAVFDIAKKLSKKVKKVDQHQRMVYSSTLTYSLDFITHLWALSKEILESEKLDFNFIKPAIIKTMDEALNAEHPAECQSGPAVVNDADTINAHMALLSDDDDLLRVYTVLTESILDWHGED